MKRVLELFAYAAIVPVAIAFGAMRAFLSDFSLRDFGSFYESGRAATEGLNPYAIYPLTYAITTPSYCGYNFNLNPPTMLPLFELLALLPPVAAMRLWQAISIVSAVIIATVLLRTYRVDARAALWFLALGALWETLYLGQVYLPLALMSAAAWLLLRNDRPISAGVLIGLIAALKPNFLVWPALLLLAGHWRSASAASSAVLVAVVGSLALYGPTVYEQWFNLLRVDVARNTFPTNGSIISLFARVDAAFIGQAIAAVLLIASAVWAFLTRPSALLVSSVALVVGVLASPIAWMQYSLFLLPIAFAHWKDQGVTAAISMWLLVVPPMVLAESDIDSWWLLVTIGSVYVWAFVGFALLVMRQLQPPTPYTQTL